MSRIAVKLINIYQIVISTFLKNLLGTQFLCRFEESCSEYTKKSILKYGIIKGSGMGVVRILKCQPLTG